MRKLEHLYKNTGSMVKFLTQTLDNFSRIPQNSPTSNLGTHWEPKNSNPNLTLIQTLILNFKRPLKNIMSNVGFVRETLDYV